MDAQRIKTSAGSGHSGQDPLRSPPADAQRARRGFVRACGIVAVCSVVSLSLATPRPALAVDHLKMMIPANPGGGWDSTGRALGAAMVDAGAVKNVQYDNKGGAAGTIGLAQFVNVSKGDPNALIVGGMVMVGGIIASRSQITLKQVTPIARLTSEYEVIVVPASSPIKTFKELVDKFKQAPGSVAWGGGSAGGSDHILIGLLAKQIGLDPKRVNYVPFKGGGEAIAAIIGGHVGAGVSGYSEFEQQIKAGKMRPLAISSAERQQGIDIPTMKEQGYDVELANWRSVFGAPGISKEQRDAMVKAVKTGVDGAAWKKSLEEKQWSPAWLGGDEFAAFLEKDQQRIEEILGSLGMKK